MRLIDADQFKGKVIASHTGCGVIKLIAINDVPTACDLDKVVEELRNVAYERYGNDGMGGERVVNMDDAIEIVKGSGSDLELECEWKLEDEDVNLYATGCNEYHLLCEGTLEENKYRYCPYCGKKIKEAVV